MIFVENKIEVFNQSIFGKQKGFADTDPKNGLTDVKVISKEIGNIPGMLDHWDMDIAKRKKDIAAWQKRSKLIKAVHILKRKAPSQPTVSGEELLKMHPTKNARMLVKQLEQHPTNMNARIELVSIVIESGREFPIEAYRSLYLQAMVALSYDEYDISSIQVVLCCQATYFNKLHNKCKRDVDLLVAKLKSGKHKKYYAEQSAFMLLHINEIKVNLNIIKGYQKQFSRNTEGNSSFNARITIDEITGFLIEAGKDNEERDARRKIMIRNASLIISQLRYLPMLFKNSDKLMENMQKLDNNDPVIHFLRGRLSMSQLVFMVARYEGGDHGEGIANNIQELFKVCYHQYAVAARKVGKSPKTNTEITIFLEFSNLVHYFYQVATHILEITPPRKWLEAVFTRALEYLRLIIDTGKVGHLIDYIMADMTAAGLEEDSEGKIIRTPDAGTIQN
jgi:hypothetical protein